MSATLILYGGLHPGAFSRGVYFFAFYLSGYVSDLFFRFWCAPETGTDLVEFYGAEFRSRVRPAISRG